MRPRLSFIWPRDSPAQQNPPPLATAKPYKAIAVQPPQRFIDASFAEFRQHLGEVVKRKDRNALRSMVVGKGFFWESDDSDKIDAKKSSFENFVGLPLHWTLRTAQAGISSRPRPMRPRPKRCRIARV